MTQEQPTPRLQGDLAAKVVVTGLMGLITLWNLAFAYRNIVRARSPYTYGDWVINYADGFVRRGLGGETLLAAANLSGVGLVQVAMAVIAVITLFVLGGWLIILLRNLKLIDIAIILSPIALLFGVLDPSEPGRKDIIPLAIVVAACLLMTRRRGRWPVVEIVFTALIGLVGILVHETTIFYLAPVIVLHLLRVEHDGPTGLGRIVLGAAVLALGCAFLLIVRSASVDLSTIHLMCARLGDAAPQACESFDGAIGWLRAPASYGVGTVTNQIADGTSLRVYGAPIVLALAYMVAFASRFRLGDNLAETLWGGRVKLLFHPVVLVLGFFVATLPLYVLAIDWGRWLMVWFMCGFVFLKTGAHLGFYERRTTPVFGRLTENGLAVVLLAAGLFWATPHCCGPVATIFGKLVGLAT